MRSNNVAVHNATAQLMRYAVLSHVIAKTCAGQLHLIGSWLGVTCGARIGALHKLLESAMPSSLL
jgi:hypothetical protein